MRAVLVAGGDTPSEELLRERCRQADLVIAADAGLNMLLDHRIRPDLLVGDLDSAAPETVLCAKQLGIPIRSLPAQKDETDLEWAAWTAIDSGADAICILGAGGGRMDHLLGNLAVVLWCAEHGAASCLEDDQCTIHASLEALHLHLNIGQTLSILPAGSEAVVTASGLYYPLENLGLKNDMARGISNVVTEEQVDILSQGSIYVIVNKTV